MLTENQFTLLSYCRNYRYTNQRDLAEQLDVSLGTVKAVLEECFNNNWLIEDGIVTDKGYEALKPYKVDNAIIMAAGMSSRFAPLSYEKPKGLLIVKSEILIERQIKQLQGAGIKDITVVVGYMKEQFFYLEEKFGVTIVVNDDYYRYNNTSTLMKVLNKLGNTYICSSDNYFTENVFEEYVYQSYYSAVYFDEKTEEYCITTNNSGRITNVTIGGGPDVWCMIGHVYYSKEFSDKFIPILKKEYEENPIVKEQLWEQLYMRHLDELDLYIRKYDHSVVKEFDTLDELRIFDSSYICDSRSTILREISKRLGVDEAEITQLISVKNNTNEAIGFEFVVNNRCYTYVYESKDIDEREG